MTSPSADAGADAVAVTGASPARRARAGTLLDLVPLGLAIVAEAAWISVAAGLVAEYTLQVPNLGIPALAGFVLAGVIAARLLSGRAGERWPSVALFLVAVGGMLGWLSDPAARSTLSSQGVVPALGVNVAGWFAGLAVLRGFAHARLPISAATLGTVFGVGIPCLAVAALAGGMIAEPYRAIFIADTTVAVIVFAGASTLALAIARLTAVGAGAGFDWRRNPAWVALLVVLVLTTLAVAVPASDASPVIALLAGASVGPILVIGLVVGFNRGMIRTVLLVSAGVVLLVGLIRLLGGSPLAINLGLDGGTIAPATPNDPGPVAPIGVLVIIVVAIVLVLVLARLWSRRGAHEASDVDEVRSIDHGDATTAGPSRRRFGRRHREPDPGDAVAAYVRLLSDIDGRPSVRREATETPAAHAARLRTTGQADLSFELLAADYALARFGDVALSATEDRRAVGRWRRLRANMGAGAGRVAGSTRVVDRVTSRVPAITRTTLTFAAMLGLALAGCSPAASASPPTPSPPATSPGETAPGGAEIECDLGGHDNAFHIHSLLVVEVDGQRYAPPANIGISESCMYWVHTHDTDGIVHVEAPATVSPTLGDFLDLWEVTFPDDPLLADARAAIAAGEVIVNDAPYAGDPIDLVLEDRMRITLGS